MKDINEWKKEMDKTFNLILGDMEDDEGPIGIAELEIVVEAIINGVVELFTEEENK